ncbi:hypothetical protein JBKA6_0059 [Ichthyobacterium seriolicida]|uniref:WG repeat-containing protein n=2 Tax=Ichthyobacterium seriolicida TaxID=242600 RepID=A0A1J1E969_9FLAO|nr:hypothetical protein JBKA6_0059 [Ichthyobacterium seriolicida]
MYDYFKAKNIFTELLPSKAAGSSYGLGIIFKRNDNPFYDLEEAYTYGRRALREYSNSFEEQLKELDDLEIGILELKRLNDDIETLLFSKLSDNSSLEELGKFKERFPKSKHKKKLDNLMSNILYETVEKENTISAYRDFYRLYPNSKWAKQAKDIYEDKLYYHKTKSGDILSYRDFVLTYPENKWIAKAQEEIFRLAIKTNNEKNYIKFLKKFPYLPQSEIAWAKVESFRIKNFNNKEIIDSFINTYPNYPKKQELLDKRSMIDIDFFPLLEDGKYGFINDIGVVSVAPVYYFARNFSEELALVANETHVGYIDKKGKTVIPFNFNNGSDFKNGLAVVDIDGKSGVINRFGEFIIPCNYDKIEIGDSFLLVREEKKYSFFKHDGTRFTQKVFDVASVFIKGLSIAKIGNYFGVLNEKLGVLIPFTYDSIERISPELFKMKKNGKWSLFNDKGMIISKKYKYIGALSEEYIMVENRGKYGFLNTKGDEVIRASLRVFKDHRRTANFKNGYSKFFYKDKYGIINKKGKQVIPNKYVDIKIGENGLFACRLKNYGFINSKNRLILKHIYQDADTFKDGMTVVKYNGKYGVINEKGKNIIPFKYSVLKSFVKSFFIAFNDNVKKGLIDTDDKVLVPMEYSKIELLKNNIAKLTKASGDIHYFNLITKSFLYPIR